MAKKPRKPRSLTFGTRPTRKATPALIKAILADLARGLTRRQACAANGIGETTLREWEKRPEFGDLRARTEAVRINYALSRIEQCNEPRRKGDWKRWAWFLTKTFPKQFGDDPTSPLIRLSRSRARGERLTQYAPSTRLILPTT
jgi:hypothetical protein